jgi:glycine cleavage system H protein
MSRIPAVLKYTKEHEWVKIEESGATIGITDHAQSQLGDIVYVDLSKAGKEVKFMKAFGALESVKAASDVYAPLSGKVLAINEALSKNPELINQDCYDKGWLIKIEPTNPEEVNKLLDAKAYGELAGK